MFQIYTIFSLAAVILLLQAVKKSETSQEQLTKLKEELEAKNRDLKVRSGEYLVDTFRHQDSIFVSGPVRAR